MVIDDKGGEVMHKDKEKMTKGENFDIGGEIWKQRDQLKFEHTSRGSKLIDLNDAFHMIACMAQVLNLKFHACVVYASCKIEWWNEKLACIGW